MKNEDKIGTSNAGTVTIPRAEYEQMQGQISVLEKQVELLNEFIRAGQDGAEQELYVAVSDWRRHIQPDRAV